MADEAKLPIPLSVAVDPLLNTIVAPVVALPLSVNILISVFVPDKEVYCHPFNPVALTGGVDK